MRARRALWSWKTWMVAGGCGAAVAACGGTTTDGVLTPPTDGGGGAAAAGATGASGGGGGASGGSNAGGAAGSSSGGTASSNAGGSSAGGAAGAGGALAGDAGSCPNPILAGMTRICLTITPEQITPKKNDPNLDESGVLVVQIFDTPTPAKQNPVTLADRVLPPGAVLGGADGSTGPEIALGDLKELRFDKAFPATVYIRVFFVDDPSSIGKKNGQLGFGTWIGGMDLSGGFVANLPLMAVPLNVGQGNAIDVSLTALRRLHVTVHRAVAPTGDGQGPLNVVAVNSADPTKKPPVFGFASEKCADLSTSDVTLNGFIIGSGPLWVTGVLNDLGQPGDLPAGSLASLDFAGSNVTIPTELSYAPTDYAVSATINLNYAVPWNADAGAVPPNSCADLAAGADAGP